MDNPEYKLEILFKNSKSWERKVEGFYADGGMLFCQLENGVTIGYPIADIERILATEIE